MRPSPSPIVERSVLYHCEDIDVIAMEHCSTHPGCECGRRCSYQDEHKLWLKSRPQKCEAELGVAVLYLYEYVESLCDQKR